MKGGWPRKPIEERLWSKVHKCGINECWNWTGSPKEGYGHIKLSGERVPTGTHRVAYMLTYGAIPKGLFVCHKCDNKRCCNPSHLFLGTPQENSLDMYYKNRDPLSRGTRYQPDVLGEKNGRAKLLNSDVKCIQSTNVEVNTLARIFGVNVSTIRRARKRHIG